MAETKKETKATSTIYSKLLEFQKLNISVVKGKENPHFRSKFADINEILEKIKEPLSNLGVVIIQIPTQDGLKTILHDTDSGTEVEGYLEFCQRNDAQKLGSNITYYRRYSLLAMLGLEDEDDDGNKAVAKAKASAEPAMTLDKALAAVSASVSAEDLLKRYRSLPTNLQNDDEVIAKCKEVKENLENNQDEQYESQ